MGTQVRTCCTPLVNISYSCVSWYCIHMHVCTVYVAHSAFCASETLLVKVTYTHRERERESCS